MDKTKQHTVFVAYHKAGHAVASCQLGFGARKVTIVPTDTAEGSMSPKGYVQLHRLEWDTFTGARLGRFHDKIVVLLAGVEAQRRYSPRSVRSLHLHRKDSDFSRADELLFRLHGHDNECRAAFRYLQIRTQNLVNNEMNWARIEGLAKALIERGTLIGDEVKEVFRESVDAQLKKEKKQLQAGTAKSLL